MKEIITVTDRALNQIKKIIKNSPDHTKGIIVGVKSSGCNGYSYKIDFATKFNVQNSESINKDGFKVFIDKKAVMFLLGSEMDYIVDKLSARFVFNNPNEKSVCGCGESFSLN